MLAKSDYAKLEKVRGMCTTILDEYEKVPADQLIQQSRDMMAYARAARNLCDAIEAGHRDSALGSAFAELDSLMQSMIDIRQRVERKRELMNDTDEHENETPTEPQGLLPPTTPPPPITIEDGLKAVMQAIENLPDANDDKKIGLLIGITMVYCRRAGKKLSDIVKEVEERTLKETDSVLDPK